MFQQQGRYGNRRQFPEPYLTYPTGSPVKEPCYQILFTQLPQRYAPCPPPPTYTALSTYSHMSYSTYQSVRETKRLARGIQVEHLQHRPSNPSTSSSMMSEISPNNCSTFLFLSLSSESLTSVGGTAAATCRIGNSKRNQNLVKF
jgi:hypothetical protein